jgi:signal peptidase I
LSKGDFHDLAGQILQNGHGVRFQASGGSMRPFILDGDILEVAPKAGGQLRPGDVLLVAACEGKWLAHRVVKTGHRDGQPAFLIKGDACPSPDGWFGSEQVLGRVVAVDHGSKRIELTSGVQRLRARLWVSIAPWVPKFAWLPERVRRYLRQLLFRELMPD